MNTYLTNFLIIFCSMQGGIYLQKNQIMFGCFLIISAGLGLASKDFKNEKK